MNSTLYSAILLATALLAACENGPIASAGVGPEPHDPFDISALDIF